MAAAWEKPTQTLKTHKSPALGSGSAHHPTLTKKLFAVGTCWRKENQFPPMECHWAYQLHSWAGAMSRGIGQHNTDLMNFLKVFVCLFVCFSLCLNARVYECVLFVLLCLQGFSLNQCLNNALYQGFFLNFDSNIFPNSTKKGIH